MLLPPRPPQPDNDSFDPPPQLSRDQRIRQLQKGIQVRRPTTAPSARSNKKGSLDHEVSFSGLTAKARRKALKSAAEARRPGAKRTYAAGGGSAALSSAPSGRSGGARRRRRRPPPEEEQQYLEPEPEPEPEPEGLGVSTRAPSPLLVLHRSSLTDACGCRTAPSTTSRCRALTRTSLTQASSPRARHRRACCST